MSRLLLCSFAVLAFQVSFTAAAEPTKPAAAAKKTEVAAAPKELKAGDTAPEFKIKDIEGREIDLAKLTEKGPVLVRLTCGCSGCDKELAYFQELHKTYKDQGLISIAVFKEPDTKVQSYAKEKKLDMLYAVDTKGASWGVFQTTTMPSNFLIAKGGKIAKVAKGCDPSGLVLTKVSENVAGLVNGEKVDLRVKVEANKAAAKK